MKTKILCTLGPASLDPGVIRRLDAAGVDLFRLNLSHTRIEDLAPTVELVRRHTDKPLCLDTDGAQVRCGIVAGDLCLSEGHTVRLTPRAVTGTPRLLTLRPASLFGTLAEGHVLSVDFNGALLQVTKAAGGYADAVVIEGGRVGSNRAVTIDPPPALPALTDKDIEAVKIGRALGVRHVALSFARRTEDVVRLRKLAGEDSYVISKIESRAGVRNMDGIISASDAVLIDRGDLSREIPLEHVPMHQKEIIRRCNSASTPAFVATNLLESMVANRRPTIAEANDIINTLLDGAHGLVLASETTIGQNPVASVEMVASLIQAFEWSRGRRLTHKRPARAASLPPLSRGQAAGARPLAG